MKYIKQFHTILGIVPFVWFISFLSILIIGTIKLGYIPEYGNIIDPEALKIKTLGLFHFLFFMAAYCSFYLWIIFSIVLVVLYKRRFIPNTLSLILFLIGVLGYFIFKFVFSKNFLWVFD